MSAPFKFKAISPNGTRESGIINANDEQAVENLLRSQNLNPIKISPVTHKWQVSLFGFMKSGDYENLIMFTNGLATMHRAGIPLLRALSIIKVGKKEGRFNKVIIEIKDNIQSGHSLSEAMSKFKDIFSKVYISCVAAGEESGKLEITLDELASMLEQEMELTRQIKSGVRYPLMVIGAIVMAFFILMNFVIPRFVDFYSSFQADLPLPTKIVMGVSGFVTTYWPLMLGATIAFAFGLKYLLGKPNGKLWFDNLTLKIPIIGTLIIKGNVARFSLMFRILTSSGLTIVKSIEILAATVKNAVISNEIRALGELFRRGKDIDVTDSEFRYFPEQALYMLAIGLESGSLDSMLGELGDYYSKQVLYTSRQLTSIIEPILTLVMGIFVLILALAIFLPMWNLIKVFQN